MTFYEWLVKKYTGEDSPLGDLAEDIEWDKCIKDVDNTQDAIRAHLRSHSACQEALDTFEAAWKLYEIHTRERADTKDIDLTFPDTVTDLEIYLCNDRPQINVCMQDKQAPPWHGTKWIEQVLTLDEAKRLAQHLTEWVKKWEEQGADDASGA